MTAVTLSDLSRLLAEMLSADWESDEEVPWSGKDLFPDKTRDEFVAGMEAVYLRVSEMEDDERGPFLDVLWLAFQMGWESHRQFS